MTVYGILEHSLTSLTIRMTHTEVDLPFKAVIPRGRGVFGTIVKGGEAGV